MPEYQMLACKYTKLVSKSEVFSLHFCVLTPLIDKHPIVYILTRFLRHIALLLGLFRYIKIVCSKHPYYACNSLLSAAVHTDIVVQFAFFVGA